MPRGRSGWEWSVFFVTTDHRRIPQQDEATLQRLLMAVRGRSLLGLAAALSCLPWLPAQALERLDCWMNNSHQSCVITPWGKGGFEISFSGSAIFRFVPAGPPTTDRRPMRDEQGRLWLMSGHHSFILEEQGGFKNRISVSSVSTAGSKPASGSANHASHSPVKLNGHGKPTVPLYARPDFAAPLAGMGVSGEVLHKISCRSDGSIGWCRVGYPNQAGRELWVPTSSLTFLSDGE